MRKSAPCREAAIRSMAACHQIRARASGAKEYRPSLTKAAYQASTFRVGPMTRYSGGECGFDAMSCFRDWARDLFCQDWA